MSRILVDTKSRETPRSFRLRDSLSYLPKKEKWLHARSVDGIGFHVSDVLAHAPIVEDRQCTVGDTAAIKRQEARRGVLTREPARAMALSTTMIIRVSHGTPMEVETQIATGRTKIAERETRAGISRLVMPTSVNYEGWLSTAPRNQHLFRLIYIMESSENINRSHLFIARDIIDMARDYKSDYTVIEYLSSICFNLARISEGQKAASSVDWDVLFSILDTAYSHRDHSIIERLDPPYRLIVSKIENTNSKN